MRCLCIKEHYLKSRAIPYHGINAINSCSKLNPCEIIAATKGGINDIYIIRNNRDRDEIIRALEAVPQATHALNDKIIYLLTAHVKRTFKMLIL